MAIQVRRGAYEDFDPDKMLPGEWACVVSGDTNADDGLSVYMCFKAGTVKRMATYEDMVASITEAASEVVENISSDVTAELVAATEAANTAAETASTATEAAETAAEAANAAAETANTAAETAEAAAETANNATTYITALDTNLTGLISYDEESESLVITATSIFES